MSVTIRLTDDLDVSRGDLICRPQNKPVVAQNLDAMVCWLSERSTLSAGGRYLLKHTTRTTKCIVGELQYRLDVNTLHREESPHALALNEIGRLRLRTQSPVLFDEYRRNRATGSFILIDEGTNATVAGGMILGEAT
jgi:bifunctional enzyme CysN/CysC